MAPTRTPDARVLRGGLCLAEAQHIDRTPSLPWSTYQREAAERALLDAVTVFGFGDVDEARRFPCTELRVALPRPAGVAGAGRPEGVTE